MDAAGPVDVVGEGRASFLRPRSALRRRGLGRVTVVLAAVPFLVAALTSSLRVREPLVSLAAAETIVFVPLPDGIGLCRGQPAASRVALAAGRDGKPGGRPVLDGEAPPSDDGEGAVKLKPGQETHDMQLDRVEKRTQWLRSLKGKFVPWGPKPWDKPRFTKVCIQSRLQAKQAANTKILNQVVEEIRRISGKQPYITKARVNVAALQWRKGMQCGVAVTLKGDKMMDFLNRLNTLILPRVRDFEGLWPTSVDNWGNFWMGFENQEPFKELDALVDSRELVHGFDVGIINNCFTQADGLKLMKDYGFPFGDPRPPKVKPEPLWMANSKKAKKKAAARKKR